MYYNLLTLLPDPSFMRRCCVGITGASGGIYGIRLVEELLKRDYEVYLYISKRGKEILNFEVKGWDERVKGAIIGSEGPLSGSFPLDFMVVAPCTLNTMAKLAHGICDNEITRAAMVCMKERRPLVLLVREMPWPPQSFLSAYFLSLQGVIVMPASPGYYPKPKSLEDVVNFVVGKILDALGIDNELFRRWMDDREISKGSNRDKGGNKRR